MNNIGVWSGKFISFGLLTKNCRIGQQFMRRFTSSTDGGGLAHTSALNFPNVWTADSIVAPPLLLPPDPGDDDPAPAPSGLVSFLAPVAAIWPSALPETPACAGADPSPEEPALISRLTGPMESAIRASRNEMHTDVIRKLMKNNFAIE